MKHLLLELQYHALLRLETLAPRPGPDHLRLGERGELEALFFLRRQGYLVVEQRWRTPELHGDIDLVAWEDDTLAIIEVKTRSARTLTPAAASVNDSKRTMLRRMAYAYRRTLPRLDAPVLIRFDVVSVYLPGGRPQCELVRGAFSLDRTPRWHEGNAYGV